MRGLLKCKYILRRAYSQNDLQVSTEYREEKLNNDGILKYNPKVYCGNKPCYTVEKWKIIIYKPRIDPLCWCAYEREVTQKPVCKLGCIWGKSLKSRSVIKLHVRKVTQKPVCDLAVYEESHSKAGLELGCIWGKSLKSRFVTGLHARKITQKPVGDWTACEESHSKARLKYG